MNHYANWTEAEVKARNAQTKLGGRLPLSREKEPQKRHKYGAKATTVDGIRFDSKKEAQHYLFLKSRERQGEITDLQLQVEFPLEVEGILICKYVCDFRFKEQGQVKVVDAKGILTPIYRLKKKLVRAIYGIEIIEV